MLPRLVRLAYVLGVILPTVLALQLFLVFDGTEGAGAQFQVVAQSIAADGRVSTADLAPVLQETATSTGADVGRIVVDVSDPTHRKHLYAVVGREGGEVAQRLADGYRHFDPRTEEEYRPFVEVGDVDPRGYYLVWGDRADAEAVVAAMGQVGLTAELAPFTGSVVDFLTDPAVLLDPVIGTAAAVSVLALMVMVGGGVVMSAQGYGVQRLQGRSFGVAVARDLAEVGRLLLVTLCAVAVVGGVALWFYNGGARSGELVLMVAVAVALVLGVIVLTHLAAAGLAFRVPILAAVKGQFSAGWALVGILGVRVVGVLLAASVAFATVQAALQVSDRSAAQERWSSDPDAVYVQISGQMGGDDPEVEARYAAMAHAAVDSGDAVLVDDVTQDVAAVDPATGAPQRGGDAAPCPVLLVSDSYLARQQVLDQGGSPVTAVAGDAVTVLAPPACQAFAREDVPSVVTGTSDTSGTVSIVHREIAAGQDQFTYGTVRKVRDAALLHDAVLVVVPPGVDVLSDAFFGAYLTQGNVVFDDAETAGRYVTEHEVGTIVNGIWSARDYAAAQYAEVVSNLRISLLSLLVAVVVLVVTAVSVSAVHVRRSAQLVYVRYITGWPQWYSHRLVLTLELVLAAVVVGAGASAAAAPQAVRFQAAVFGGQAAQWRVGIAVAVALLAVCSVLVGLRWATARLISTRSADS
ncbi:bacteriocin-associated integral membrane family protein [Cellulosimicrobium cellulans]|uniref:ABC3 transporter permease protein domain-containing protein n=1 Tax=Cellulosimicrobium cellulans F16 TaxID=1350482 RepID=A0A0M0FB70_CELCE|nr:hypothetical protein [Cellulosimicrobium cellulans]KON74693.1 hypothetical protein M768_01805 [Cellulosimicrobium cellulans F16]